MTDNPRGIRKRNPGNIEHTGTPWQGLDDPPSDGRFCRFKTMAHGCRAIARILITYQDKRKAEDGSAIDTVAEIINRWAPPHENDTNAYAAHVRERLGLERGESVDVHEYSVCKGLVRSIIVHENGHDGAQQVKDADIDRGLMMAGVEPGKKSLAKSRTMVGGSVAASAAAAGPVVQTVDRIQDTVADWSTTTLTVLAVVAVVGVLIVFWSRIEDHLRGWR